MTAFDGPAAIDSVEGSLMADQVSVLAPKPAVTVASEATLQQAVETMMSHGVGALLVVDDTGALVGVLTERDFLTKYAADESPDRLVREFMTPNPVTVAPTDPLAFVIRKMDVGGYRHLPVVTDGIPTGVVSVRDVLRHLMKMCQDH
jgi:CBS domain-containing protein